MAMRWVNHGLVTTLTHLLPLAWGDVQGMQKQAHRIASVRQGSPPWDAATELRWRVNTTYEIGVADLPPISLHTVAMNLVTTRLYEWNHQILAMRPPVAERTLQGIFDRVGIVFPRNQWRKYRDASWYKINSGRPYDDFVTAVERILRAMLHGRDLPTPHTHHEISQAMPLLYRRDNRIRTAILEAGLQTPVAKLMIRSSPQNLSEWTAEHLRLVDRSGEWSLWILRVTLWKKYHALTKAPGRRDKAVRVWDLSWVVQESSVIRQGPPSVWLIHGGASDLTTAMTRILPRTLVTSVLEGRREIQGEASTWWVESSTPGLTLRSHAVRGLENSTDSALETLLRYAPHWEESTHRLFLPEPTPHTLQFSPRVLGVIGYPVPKVSQGVMVPASDLRP